MKKLNKSFFTIYIALQAILGFFLFNLFIFPALVHGWQTAQSAEAECVLNLRGDENLAKIRVHFINKESTKFVNVLAVDNQTGKSVEFPTLRPGEVHTRSIQTGQKSIGDGTVTLNLSRPDGNEKDTRRVSYSGINCPQPTPTPVQTVTPTPTRIPTPTRVPRPTRTPTPTSMPTTTPTPSPTLAPASAPTATPVVQNINVTVQEHPSSTPAPVTQVLAATEVRELPRTGSADIILFGLLLLLPAGIFLRNKSI